MRQHCLKILIFGSSGNLGIRVVKELSKHHFVKGFVRDSSTIEKVISAGAKDVYTGNLENVDSIKNAINNDCFDVLINTAYIHYGPNIIFAAKECNIKRFIFIGSTGIYTKLPSKSAEDKRVAEKKIIEFDVPYTILRPTMIIGHPNDGNISRLVRAMKKYRVIPIIGSGDALVQPVLIDDIVKTLRCIIENDSTIGKSYNIGAPYPISNLKLFQLVKEIFGIQVWFIKVPLAVITQAIKLLIIFNMAPVTTEQILRFTEDKNIDAEALQKELGINLTPIQASLSILKIRMEPGSTN